MNSEKTVAAHHTASHYYEYIESFPGQSHQTSEDRQNSILGSLRQEFYSTDDSPHKSTPG